jgi:peptidyl-prolyl cis-trans isomerase B (cyclophilin B)
MIVVAGITITGFTESVAQKTIGQGISKQRSHEEIARSILQLSGEVDTVATTPVGKIVFEFFPKDAPQYVENFKMLTRIGFYNGVTFHRVIPRFMIQGGDLKTKDDDRSNDGTGDPGYTIPAEFNSRKHLRGTLSMARKPDPKSAGSQFFICVEKAPHLDGQYTIFGQVIAGMDVVDKIVNVPRDKKDNPLKKVIMKSVTIVQRGKEQGLPPPSAGADAREVAVVEVVQEQ